MSESILFKTELYFVLFIFYSFCGWLLEELYCCVLDSVRNKKLTVPNRGFLSGPICPIYGSSAISMALILTPLSESLPKLFIVGIIVADSVEYLTSFIMEKLFNARWWDYSDKFLNINGRICFRHSVMWGFLSIFFIRFLHPFVLSKFCALGEKIIEPAFFILLLLFLYDLGMACATTINIRSIQHSLHKIKSAFSNFKPQVALRRKDIPKYASELREFLKRPEARRTVPRIKRLIYEYPRIFDLMLEELDEIQSVPHEFKKEIFFLELDLKNFIYENKDRINKEKN